MDFMGIANLSTQMANQNLIQEVSIAVLRNANINLTSFIVLLSPVL